MGEVLVCYRGLRLANLLQAVAGTGEGAYLAVEIIRCHANTVASEHGGLKVLHVMPSEDLHGNITFVRIIRNTRDVFSRSFSDLLQVFVALIIDETAVGFKTVHKLAECVHIFGESRENVNMVPSNAGENSYMRVVPKELGPQVERGGEVLITLKDRILGSVGEAYHAFEAFYLCAYHVVCFNTEALEHIKNHARRGGLTMRTAYYDANFVLGLLVQVFGERVNLQSQLAGAD